MVELLFTGGIFQKWGSNPRPVVFGDWLSLRFSSWRVSGAVGGPLFRLLLCPLVLGCLKVLFRASRSVYDSVSLDYFSRLEFCWPESGVPYEAFQFMSFLFRRMRMGFVFWFCPYDGWGS